MATELKRMRQLSGTAAEWAANDLVLGDGEIALLKDGDRRTVKYGDGVKRFSELGQQYVGKTTSWDKAGVAQEATGASFHFRRDAAYSGGNAGYVNTNMFVQTFVSGAGATALEWGLLSVMYNNAAAGENVAAYLQGIKQNTGPTWGAVIEVIEQNPTANPTTGTIGLELDVNCNGPDNTVPGSRVGMDMAIRRYVAGGAPAEVAWGYRIQGDAGAVVGRGYAFYPGLSVGIGFDASGATITGAAFRMAQSQVIAFNITHTRTLCHNGGGYIFGTPTVTTQWSFNDDFTLVANNVQLLGPRRPGWAAATGTLTRTTFDTATVTLPVLAQHFAALQADLTAHGLLGA